MSEGLPPTLAIVPGTPEPTAQPGRWLVRWQVENPNDAPLRIEHIWAPHGRFRADDRAIEPPITLRAGGAVTLELTVACDERPGTVVENTFLILRLRYADHAWRCFARHRIMVDQAGTPHPLCEVITVHPIGTPRSEP